MSYPLRLPENLEAEARERAAAIGISFNALIAVAVDAYLHGGQGSSRRRSPASRKSSQALKQTDRTEGRRPGADLSDGQGPDWRFFHPDPDMWPLVDPEFIERWRGVDQQDDAACIALELEYWSTRERPPGD